MSYILNNSKPNGLTHSSVTFAAVYFGLLILLFACCGAAILVGVEALIAKVILFSFFGSVFIALTLFGTKISGGYVLSDMLIIKPIIGKKLITPLNGVAFRTVSILGKVTFTLVLVRLDGKKMFHLFGGGAEDLIAEQERMLAFLSEMKQNKKVNHKPGSVNSVA